MLEPWRKGRTHFIDYMSRIKEKVCFGAVLQAVYFRSEDVCVRYPDTHLVSVHIPAWPPGSQETCSIYKCVTLVTLWDLWL